MAMQARDRFDEAITRLLKLKVIADLRKETAFIIGLANGQPTKDTESALFQHVYPRLRAHGIKTPKGTDRFTSEGGMIAFAYIVTHYLLTGEQLSVTSLWSMRPYKTPLPKASEPRPARPTPQPAPMEGRTTATAVGVMAPPATKAKGRGRPRTAFRDFMTARRDQPTAEIARDYDRIEGYQEPRYAGLNEEERLTKIEARIRQMRRRA